MILIGLVNLALGYCSYSRPSDVHERIIPDVRARQGGATPPAPPRIATGCPPAITARIEADRPGATITPCTPDRVTAQRGDHTIELELSGSDIVGVAKSLALPEIPAAVMRAFAVASRGRSRAAQSSGRSAAGSRSTSSRSRRVRRMPSRPSAPTAP